MALTYTRVNWENAPSKVTPINDINLNNMDKGIADATDEINNLLTQLQDIVTQISTINGQISTINTNITDIQTTIADVPHWEDVS